MTRPGRLNCGHTALECDWPASVSQLACYSVQNFTRNWSFGNISLRFWNVIPKGRTYIVTGSQGRGADDVPPPGQEVELRFPLVGFSGDVRNGPEKNPSYFGNGADRRLFRTYY